MEVGGIKATPRLRAELPRLAAGRALVIDYFASARGGVVVGDLTVDFGPEPEARTHAKLAELDGIPVYAARRLLPLLDESGPSLDARRLPFGRRMQLILDRPEHWLDFPQEPGVVRRRGFV
jgi:hypothetical protein